MTAVFKEVVQLDIKAKLKNIRDGYVINQVKRIKIPDFEMDRKCRLED